MIGGLFVQDKHHHLFQALDALIGRSSSQEMPEIVAILEAARNAILLHLTIGQRPVESGPVSHVFHDALDKLIGYCRHHGLDEVLDHLLEAQMVCDERAPAPENAGNVITFSFHGEAPQGRLRENGTDD